MASLVVIALGSNLGDRLAHLRQAREALRAVAVPESLVSSSIYQTEPVHCPDDSPDFYNAVFSFSFDGTAAELHTHTRAIEKALGRERSVINAPRTIDIDLLLFGGEMIHTPDLQIPHPRLHLRRFVLQPLTEILPDLVLPGLNLSVSQQLAALDSPEPPLERIEGMW